VIHRLPGLIITNAVRDPLGSGAAIVMLIWIVVSLLGVMFALLRSDETYNGPRREWAILAEVLIGVGVAGYLTYVEINSIRATCGPIGDCNAVQQSPYARFMGIPMGVIGLVGYALISLAWLVRRYGPARIADGATLALFGFVFLGTAFTAYLTYLEAFVIGAGCAWCLATATVMTALLWLSVAPAKQAIAHMS
jgi:uncharacterized membrane protein